MIKTEDKKPTGVSLHQIRLPQDDGYKPPPEVKAEPQPLKKDIRKKQAEERKARQLAAIMPDAPKRGRPRRDQIDETDPK